MTQLYHDAQRRLQDRFDTRRLADRIEERIVHDLIDEGDARFIAARDHVLPGHGRPGGQAELLI